MRFGGLIAAIIFAAVAAVVVLRMSNKPEAPAAAPVSGGQASVKTATIYVAAQPITVGTTITQDMVSTQPWPEHLMLDGFMRADAGTNVVGMVARASFQVQEPLLASKLANPNDPNFLAGSLPKGMRVITLQTNEIEGVGGFVFPGDHVDVMLTHQVLRWVASPSGQGGANAVQQQSEPVTETLLTNALVVAVDQRAASSNSTDKNGNLIVPRSVSLMVTPTDAQRLRLASQKGSLTLDLRSLKDKESSDPLIVTTVGDISSTESASGVAGNGVMIVRGIEATQSTSVDAPASGSTPAPSASPVAHTTPAAATAAAPAVTVVPAPAPTPAAPVAPQVTSNPGTIAPVPTLPPAP